MKINIIFIPAKKDFSGKDKIDIRNAIRKNAINASKLLPFKSDVLTFTVYPWARKGANGFTQSRDWIRMTINPKELNSKKEGRQKTLNRLVYLVYHEMHHAARGYTGFLPQGQEHILINSILSEGLADVFAEENRPDIYDSKKLEYKVRQMNGWLGKIDKIKWRKETFRNPWIFGGEGKPDLLGYKLGRYIMTELKKKNPKLNATKLVKADAKRILKLSEIKFKKK